MLVYIFSTRLSPKLVFSKIPTQFVDSTHFNEFELSSNRLSPKSGVYSCRWILTLGNLRFWQAKLTGNATKQCLTHAQTIPTTFQCLILRSRVSKRVARVSKRAARVSKRVARVSKRVARVSKRVATL